MTLDRTQQLEHELRAAAAQLQGAAFEQLRHPRCARDVEATLRQSISPRRRPGARAKRSLLRVDGLVRYALAPLRFSPGQVRRTPNLRRAAQAFLRARETFRLGMRDLEAAAPVLEAEHLELIRKLEARLAIKTAVMCEAARQQGLRLNELEDVTAVALLFVPRVYPFETVKRSPRLVAAAGAFEMARQEYERQARSAASPKENHR